MFELVWLEKRPAEEAAVALNRPKSWVYVTKFRILKRLKEEIEFLTADEAFYGSF